MWSCARSAAAFWSARVPPASLTHASSSVVPLARMASMTAAASAGSSYADGLTHASTSWRWTVLISGAPSLVIVMWSGAQMSPVQMQHTSM